MVGNQAEIDWPQILGPLYGPKRDLAPGEVAELEKAIFAFATRAIRCHPGCADHQLPFATEPVPWYSLGRFVPQSDVRPGAFLQYASGDYYIQDAGSMLALALCDLQGGEWVLDACASPGGKSTGILEQLQGTGLLISNEVIGGRLAPLKQMLDRSGYDNFAVTNQDLKHFAGVFEFDCVVVDAPCSGQSMVARNKQTLSSFAPKQISHCASRQERILQDVAGVVRPGGHLVYSTCTFAFAENEGVLELFLGNNPDWELVPVAGLEAYQSSYLPCTYRMWPHRHASAGAFAAKLRRRGSSALSSDPSERGKRARGGSRWEPWTGPLALEFFEEAAPARWFELAGDVHRFPGAIPESWVPACVGALRIATKKSNRWEPAYGSARLVNSVLAKRSCVTLDRSQARSYVAGDVVRVDSQATGWCVVVWEDRQLGWGKLVQGTLKNHFPKALRQQAS